MSSEQNIILVVDDEPAIRALLAEYFTSLSYASKLAGNAESAIEILNSDQPLDLLITDIDLPGMSGIDLLKIAREIRPEIPVVIITGLRTLDFAISAIKHGAHDYITKPFDLGDVRKIVERTLRYRRSSVKKDEIFRFANSLSISYSIPTAELDAGVIADYLARFLLNAHFCSKEEYHQFYVAFMETLINAIEHGNLELPSSIKGTDFAQFAQFEELRETRMADPHFNTRKVNISFMYSPQRFSLTITDEGKGFDWKSFAIHDGPPDMLNTQSHGRGFMLIHHIIDEVFFNEAGNSITLIRSKIRPSE